MIKKLIYILLFLPLFVSGQFNLFWNHPYEGWNLDDADYNFCYQPDGIDAGNFDIDFSSDGKYMFIIEGYTYDDYVRRWILSPPWDITTSNTLNQS